MMIQNRHGKGEEIVDGLRNLAETLRAGKPLESQFTVRTFKIPPPAQCRGKETRRVASFLR